ncbi:MAG: ETEC_3214 domain-containing protein [Solirubrobacterales bacterium]
MVAAINNIVEDAGAILGAVVALIAFNAAAKSFVRRTIGRRRDRYARLGRLGTGAQLSFFVAVLGEPPAIRQTIKNDNYRTVVRRGDPGHVEQGEEIQDIFISMSFVEAIFIDRDYYVQVICDLEETVLAFSVTVRRRNFHPVFQVPGNIGWREKRRHKKQFGEPFVPAFKLRLGRTRFAELDDPEFLGCRFQAAVGARSFFYSEDRYYGFPGHYQTFVFTASSAAPGPGSVADLAAGISQAKGEKWPDKSRDDQPGWEALSGIHAFRRKTPVTTFSVLRADLWVENFPTRFGPHGDEVGTLP